MKAVKRFLSLVCAAALVFSYAALPSLAAGTGSPVITMRIEGQKSTIYSGSVGFTQGRNFYDIMASALKEKGIAIDATVGKYGHEIHDIGGEGGAYPLWWHLYVNGKASDVGADSLLPKDGDDIVFYLGDDSVVVYPTVTLSPKIPVAGAQETVNVSGTVTDYTDPNNPVTKTIGISGVAIAFDGKTYTTDGSGNTVITMPKAGSYIMTAVKEAKDSTPAIVRTGNMDVAVSESAVTPPDDGNKPSTPAKTPAAGSDIKDAAAAGARYLINSGVSDWSTALAVRSAGLAVPQSYIDAQWQDLSQDDGSNATHLAGVIIGLKAAGADPQDFGGRNLVSELCSGGKVGNTGLNGYAYALLALDCGGYDVPAGSQISRPGLIDSILSYQKSGGAFSLDKTSAADSDMTAIAVTALAPYMSDAKVKTAVDSAVAYLSAAQQADGGFVPAYSSGEVCETAAQVAIALSSVGIDAENDPRFIKSGASAISFIMSFKNADGSFSHVAGAADDVIATGQAVAALSSYINFSSGGKRIYDLASVPQQAAQPQVMNPKTGDRGAAPIVIVTFSSLAAAILLKKKRH